MVENPIQISSISESGDIQSNHSIDGDDDTSDQLTTFVNTLF